jgi:hypothetical protein
MKLREVSPTDEFPTLVVNQLLAQNKLLRYAEFYKMSGDAENKRKTTDEDGGAFRNKNVDFSPVTNAPGYEGVELKIFGGKYQTDNAEERRGKDLASVHDNGFKRFVTQAGKNITDKIINADGSGQSFFGINAQMPPSQVIQFGANGTLVPASDKDAIAALLEQMYILIESVQPSVLMAAAETIGRLTTISQSVVRWEKTSFGDQVAFFGDTPIISPGKNGAKAPIIGLNETVGTSNDCTSILGLRFGEEEDLSLATSTGVDAKNFGMVENFMKARFEIDLDVVLLDDTAIGKIEGIRLKP